MPLLSLLSRRAGTPRSRRRRAVAVGVAGALTALSFAVLPQSAALAGAGIVAGGVYVPDNSSVREENSFAVYQVVNGGILPLVNRAEFDAMGYDTATIAVVPVGGLGSVPRVPNDGTLLRERSDPHVWLVDDGANRFWIEDPAVLVALGYSYADVRSVANGSLGGLRIGDSIGSGDLPGESGLPGASAASYHPYGSDSLAGRSGDGKAESNGRVDWYHGSFPYGYRHRGQLTNDPVVYAAKPVNCIWAQVRWGYPTASVTFPPGASVSGAQEVGQFFVSCRQAGATYPFPIRLGGLTYTKALLNSVTLTLCSSDSKSAGPRECGTVKHYY